MIKIVDGKIGYSETILHIDHLDIPAGKFVALIGKNGSGKSTFFKSMCGIIPTLGGSFIINGQPISELTAIQLSKIISFAGSIQQSIQYMTIKDYVLLGRSPYTGLLGRYQVKDHEISDEAIDLFNLLHLRDRELFELSDGERQLAAFARAFAQETPIILLDEPTAFLDYGNKRTLIKLLKEATKKQSKCVIMSTHDIDLCLDEKIEVLGIDPIHGSFLHFSANIDRHELLQHIFPEK